MTKTYELWEAWDKARVGISPLAGNIKLKEKAAAGKIIREVITEYENGILLVGYRDKQNRMIATVHEAPDK